MLSRAKLDEEERSFFVSLGLGDCGMMGGRESGNNKFRSGVPGSGVWGPSVKAEKFWFIFS